MSDSGIRRIHRILGDHTMDEIATIVEKLSKENKQYREQTDIERGFYALYVMLHAAWEEAKTNEDCARILRLFVTDLEAFKEEYPHGERRYRKGSEAYKLWKKAAKDAAKRKAAEGGEVPPTKEEI